MPNGASREWSRTPLIQIRWSTRTKERTRTAVITIGGPILTFFVLLVGAPTGWVLKAAKSALALLGAGR